MDKALSQGMCDIFRDAKKLWCTQHMQERDAHKLKTIGCNHRTQKRVWQIFTVPKMTYFSKTAKQMRMMKITMLASLKPVWVEIAPGFYQCFKNHKSKIFKDSLVLFARVNPGITVPERTLTFLPEGSRERFAAKGLQVEV